jgi:hypothetical protein
MTVATVENPTIPAQRESVESLISNAERVAMQTSRVLFYAGDVISAIDKYDAPSTMGFGGIYRSDLRTIQHNGNLGMIYRCKFTSMKTKMIDENKAMLLPADVKNWEKSYTLSNAKLGPNGWEDMQVGVDRASAHLVYKPRYPGEEIRFALQHNEPVGERGIVEVAALRGAEYPEIRAAQLFFFPNWEQIERGETRLPDTIRALETHIRARLAATRELDNRLANQYASIANDMIKSCSEYRAWGLAYLKFIEDGINEAKINGQPYSYPLLGEMVLAQLEQKRKDDLVSGEYSGTVQLVEELRAERAEKADTERRRLELEERKVRIEEMKLGITDKVDVPPQAPAEKVEATIVLDADQYEIHGTVSTVEPRLCGAPKANGDPCTRTLMEGETVCFQHNK